MAIPSRAAALLAAALFALPLSGCGCCGSGNSDGNVFAANHTDSGVPEDTNTFEMASFGDPFTGNLLGGPIAAGDARHVGAFQEDYYDARSEMQLGDVIEWFDRWVGANTDTFFDIF